MSIQNNQSFYIEDLILEPLYEIFPFVRLDESAFVNSYLQYS
jgi:hypothetical protein